MKHLMMLVLLTIAFLGCTGTRTVKDSSSSPEKMELGWMQRSDFVTPLYPTFKENYDTVHVGPDFIDMIKMVHEGVEMTVVMGTWCGDSEREVPRFLKIADLASIPPQQVRFYGVDRTKKSSDGVTEGYNIDRVPTFIFSKKGKEIGRIVESPLNSLEEDILNILADSRGK